MQTKHPRKERLVDRQVTRHEHTDDEPVDTNDTSHDDRDNGLHDELGVHDTHGGDADGGLGRSVSGTKAFAKGGMKNSVVSENRR